MTKTRRLAAASIWSALCALWLFGCADNNEQQKTDTGTAEFQQRFQPVDSAIEIKSVETDEGETLHYIDEGNPGGHPVLLITGFEDAAAIDWEYTFFRRDSEQSLTALAAEALRYCDNPLPDLAGITTPLFIYHGDADDSAPLSNIDAWMASLVNTSATTIRLYPDAGHWVQYSHLDQIFADISRPGLLFVCDESEQSILVPEAEGLALIQDMKATVGLCKTPAP